MRKVPERQLLFVSTRLSHPITATRVEMLEKEGFEIEIVGFERAGFYGRLPSQPFAVLGSLRDGKYPLRILGLLRALKKLRSAIRRNDLVYANGADVALGVVLAGMLLGKPILREVPDVEAVLLSTGMRGSLYRWVDRFIESRCHLLVLTSSGYEDYYRKWLQIDTPSVVIENKVEPALAAAWADCLRDSGPHDDPASMPLLDRPLRLGWFAQIRHPWSLDLVEHLVAVAGDRFEVVIGGVVTSDINDFDEFLERNPRVEYLGPFRHPADLEGMYAQVDLQLACYDPEIPDGWSLSCRFYDSCALGTPLVSRADTADAVRVERYQLGLVLHEKDPQAAAEELARITLGEWQLWRDNVAALAPDTYTLSDESARLADAIEALTRG